MSVKLLNSEMSPREPGSRGRGGGSNLTSLHQRTNSCSNQIILWHRVFHSRLTRIVDEKHMVNFVFSLLPHYPHRLIHPCSRGQVDRDAVNRQLLFVSEAVQLFLQLLQQSPGASHQQQDRARLQQGRHLEGHKTVLSFCLSFSRSFFPPSGSLTSWASARPNPLEAPVMIQIPLPKVDILSNICGLKKDYSLSDVSAWQLVTRTKALNCFYNPRCAGRTNVLHVLYFTVNTNHDHGEQKGKNWRFKRLQETILTDTTERESVHVRARVCDQIWVNPIVIIRK